MKKYLENTSMLDYENKRIKGLIEERGWLKLDDKQKIISIYNFVRDEINFGYNIDDRILASQVLSDGYGQCNTKGTLFMALLRGVNIPCRVHGFTIDKLLQKGAITGISYMAAPQEILHSWVELYYNNKWHNLEGYILDKKYLNKLQRKFSSCTGSFYGYGAATDNFENPQIDWDENDTYIQKEGIAKDYGIFDNPDDFYGKYVQNLGSIKKFMYQNLFRHQMNKNVDKIRQSNKY